MTASHASAPAPERKPKRSATSTTITSEIMLETTVVSTCAHSTLDRAIGRDWNRSSDVRHARGTGRLSARSVPRCGVAGRRAGTSGRRGRTSAAGGEEHIGRRVGERHPGRRMRGAHHLCGRHPGEPPGEPDRARYVVGSTRDPACAEQRAPGPGRPQQHPPGTVAFEVRTPSGSHLSKPACRNCAR